MRTGTLSRVSAGGHLRRLGAAGVSLAVLAAGWYFLAPGQLGGSASYAVIVGSSMEPRIKRGDLVVTRERATYAVGDVVAYRNPKLSRTVLHRIADRDGDRYVLKGDNNDFLDSYQPARADLLGTKWLRIPRAGTVVQWLRVPVHAAIVAGLLVFLGLAGFGAETGRRRRKRRRGARDENPPLSRAHAPGRRTPVVPGLAIAGGAGAVALVCGVLTLYAFNRPAQQEVEAGELYSQSGAFSYEAQARKSPILDRTSLTTGDALFLKLVREASVSFVYELQTEARHELSGQAGLVAELADGNGWVRTLELAPPRRFVGDEVEVSGTLDLAKLDRLVQRFEDLTESRRDAYQVTLRPNVEVEGTLAGEEFGETYAPTLTFLLNSSRLVIASESALGRANSIVSAESVPKTEFAPASISAFGRSVEVERARELGVYGTAGAAAVAVLGAIVAGLVGLRRRPDEPSTIEARYGPLLVSVSASMRLPGTAVDVESFEALVRLAERYERFILHEVIPGGVHHYSVEDDGAVYRYEARTEVPSSASPDGKSKPRREPKDERRPRLRLATRSESKP